MTIKVKDIYFSKRLSNEADYDELLVKFEHMIYFNDSEGNDRFSQGIFFKGKTAEETNYIVERAMTDKLTDEEYGEQVISWMLLAKYYAVPQEPKDYNAVYLKELDDETRLEIINICRTALKNKFNN